MFISYGLAVFALIHDIAKDEIDGLLDVIVTMLMGGGIFQAIMHCEYFITKPWNSCKEFGLIGCIAGIFLGWIIMFAVLFGAGWLFLIIDTVKYIRKKPLIYKYEYEFERNKFLKKRIKVLKKENKKLVTENKRLIKEIREMTSPTPRE